MCNMENLILRINFENLITKVKISNSRRGIYNEYNVKTKYFKYPLLKKTNIKKESVKNINPDELILPFTICGFIKNKIVSVFAELQNNKLIKNSNNIYYFDNNVKKEDIKYFLYDVNINEKHLKNTRSIGTPKYVTINNQLMYSNISPFIRNTVVAEIKKFYNQKFKKLMPSQLSILREKLKEKSLFIKFIYYSNDLKTNFDIDNRIIVYQKTFFDFLVKGFPDENFFGLIKDDNALIISSFFVEFIPSDKIKLIIEIYKHKYNYYELYKQRNINI